MPPGLRPPPLPPTPLAPNRVVPTHPPRRGPHHVHAHGRAAGVAGRCGGDQGRGGKPVWARRCAGAAQVRTPPRCAAAAVPCCAVLRCSKCTLAMFCLARLALVGWLKPVVLPGSPSRLPAEPLQAAAPPQQTNGASKNNDADKRPSPACWPTPGRLPSRASLWHPSASASPLQFKPALALPGACCLPCVLFHARRAYRSRAKNAQEAHEAIRPTRASRTPQQLPASLAPDLRALYGLVWARALASQMANAVMDQVGVLGGPLGCVCGVGVGG